MNNQKDSLTKVFEETLNKSIEANKLFLQEGSSFLKNINNKDGRNNAINKVSTEAMTTIFGEFVKLNLKHYTNLVDLSMGFMKELNQTQRTQNEENNSGETTVQPGFILEKESPAGQQVELQFLLDNTRQFPVNCELIHAGFLRENEPASSNDFRISFKPQQFRLEAGETKSVAISIYIPESANPGIYINKVQVKGFEPAHFLIRLTVTETIKKPTANGGKKEKSAEHE